MQLAQQPTSFLLCVLIPLMALFVFHRFRAFLLPSFCSLLAKQRQQHHNDGGIVSPTSILEVRASNEYGEMDEVRTRQGRRPKDYYPILSFSRFAVFFTFFSYRTLSLSMYVSYTHTGTFYDILCCFSRELIVLLRNIVLGTPAFGTFCFSSGTAQHVSHS